MIVPLFMHMYTLVDEIYDFSHKLLPATSQFILTNIPNSFNLLSTHTSRLIIIFSPIVLLSFPQSYEIQFSATHTLKGTQLK